MTDVGIPIGLTVTGLVAVENVADVEEILSAAVPVITDEYGEGAFGQLAPSFGAIRVKADPVINDFPVPTGLIIGEVLESSSAVINQTWPVMLLKKNILPDESAYEEPH